MIEMRWVLIDPGKDIKKLQYRQLIQPLNSAAKGSQPEWSEWIDVPIIWAHESK